MSRDILITPNRGSTGPSDYPTIDFGGLSSSSISLKVDNDGSIVYTGTYGALFNITDDKDGLLHSVNDVSGLPIFSVYSYDYVEMGKWDKIALVVNSDKVGVGLTAPSTKFHIYSTQSGAFRLQDGTEGDNYILISDINGVASWTSSIPGTSGTSGTSGVDGTSGTSGVDGTSGTSGVDGTSGTSGIDGTSGTSGVDGTSGTSGIGFNTIQNPADYRILTSTGSSTNSAVANTNLTYDGFTLSVHGGSIGDVGYVDFATSSLTSKTGRTFFDSTDEALSYFPNISQDVLVKTGQQLYTRCYNNSGILIPKGSAVKILSASGSLPNITLALATNDGNNQVLGLAASDIPNLGAGLILNKGILRGISINTFSINDILYLSSSVPGEYTKNLGVLPGPSTPRTNQIGYVIATGSTTGEIYVDVINEPINLTLTNIERNVLEGNVISTGAYAFGGITQTSGTTFTVGSVSGWIVKNTYTYSTLPDVINVQYAGATGLTTSYLTTADSTHLLLSETASLIQLNTFPTPQQRRENIYLGKIVHPNKVSIQNVNNSVDFDVSPFSSLRDLWTPIKLINDGIVASANGANLSINTSYGKLWGNGINFNINELDPNSVYISATSPATFQYRTQTGGSFSNTTLIDPGFYDVGGVRTAIPGSTSRATNQRIYLFSTGIIRIQYGQQYYGSLSLAVAGLQSENFIEYSNNKESGVLIGVITVTKGATNLTLTTDAQFNFVSKFGELLGGSAGLSTTTLQQAYNNSTQPEITTDSTLGAVTFKRGSASDSDNVIEVLSGSNGVTFSVTGQGKTTTNTLTIPGIYGTSGATKFVVVDDSGNTFYETGSIGVGPTGSAGATGAGGALGYYGSFYDTTNQSNPTASIAMPMLINSTYESNGISISNGSKMLFGHSGTYNIQFSSVFLKSNANAGTVDVWFSKNGQYITESNTSFNIANQVSTVASWNFITTVNSNDYIQLYWSSPETTISMIGIGTQSNPDRPGVPSLILTAQQIMYTQVGSYNVVNVLSTTYNATQTIGQPVLLVDTLSAGGDVTVNLPTAVNNTAQFVIKKIDTTTYSVIVDGNASETIDGSLTATMSVPYSSISLVSNGYNWFII